jgi:cytochrome P450
VARDPILQEALVDEVLSVTGENPISATHLDGLVLCRQAFQESMRLYPPGTALARQAIKNTRVGDQNVTTSTMILIPIFALHRHRLLWDHPNRFDLNRFAPAAVKARSRHAYLPFSAGPRVCIGASFAIMEATVILASVLRVFRLRPLAGFKPKPVARLSLLPEGGMPLLIEPR